MEKEKIIDVDFEEENFIELSDIAKNIKHFTSKQVCDALDISGTTLTYYTSFFEELLDVQRGGGQRRYTEKCLKVLKLVVDLKAQGFGLQQIKENLLQTEFKDGKALLKESNPLSIQALVNTLMDAQAEKLEIMKSEIVSSVTNKILSALTDYMDEQKERDLDIFEGIRDDLTKSLGDEFLKNSEQITSQIKNDFSETNNQNVEVIKELVSEKLGTVTESIAEVKKELNMKFISREEIEAYSKKQRGFLGNLFRRS